MGGSLRRIIAAIWLISFSPLLGCSWFSPVNNVFLVFPEPRFPPEGYDVRWFVSWLGENGTLRSRIFDPGDTVTISLPKEMPAIVRADPLGSVPVYRHRPAGTVRVPARMVPNTLLLSWEEGFAAAFLLELAETGFPLERLDVGRFTSESIHRSDGDPWCLDTRRLQNDLACGSLWVYSFRKLPRSDHTLPLPVGHWLEENPFRPAAVSDGAWTGQILEGLTRWVSEDGTAVVEVWYRTGEEPLIAVYPAG